MKSGISRSALAAAPDEVPPRSFAPAETRMRGDHDAAEQPRRIRILLLEDHTFLRQLLARTLTVEPDFEIAGECAAVSEALQIVAETPVDIVLLDINLGGEQGDAFLRQAPAFGFRGRVLAVTVGVSERQAARLLHSGCSCIFLKTEPLATLVERIRAVAGGTFKLDPFSARAVLSHMTGPERWSRSTLTQRESELLRAICEGLSNSEIADRLGAPENTVRRLLQQLYRKVGVHTRAQLASVAIERYWDELESSPVK